MREKERLIKIIKESNIVDKDKEKEYTENLIDRIRNFMLKY